jgi:hypothetical protein
MIKSRCCKAPVRICYGNEGVSYYECCQCDLATDTISVTDHKRVIEHDTRREANTQEYATQR